MLRDTNYLYEYEGNRLLGFAAERVSEWAVCVDALRKVIANRPNDNFAERTLKGCEEKLGIKSKSFFLPSFFPSIPRLTPCCVPPPPPPLSLFPCR